MAEEHSPETILQEALELSDPQARNAYLDEACADDRALRHEVESLLAAHFAADTFMGTLADSPWEEAPTEKEGDTIGRYKLGKFVRKNRTAVAVAATITFLLVAGIFGTSWYAIRATENLEISRRAEQREQEAKEKVQKLRKSELEAWERVAEQRNVVAVELMREAHLTTILKEQDLSGQIRKDGAKIPVALFRRGKNIQFQYFQRETKKWIPFHVRHGIADTRQRDLFDMVDGKTLRFPDEKLGQAIEETDLSYEDLAMSFLYWPKCSLERSEKIKGQDCWLIRAINPAKTGNYRQVRVWIHKKSHALMQVVGYNAQGQPLKRMQVIDIMKTGDATETVIGLIRGDTSGYTFRRIRFDSIDPVANKVVGVTYLEFDRPKPVPRPEDEAKP